MSRPNTSKSIFTDIRLAYQQYRDESGLDKPTLRRSFSDEPQAARAEEFQVGFPAAAVGPAPGPPSSRSNGFGAVTGDRPDTFKIPHTPAGARKRSADHLSTPLSADSPQSGSSHTSKKRRRDHSGKSARDEPPSPLFFSNSPRQQRPPLPPRFSSSEAAARMLSKAQGEERNVKTVTLARGSFANAEAPSTSARGYARSRVSSEQNRFESRSPDHLPEKPDALKLFQRAGAAELLEQDQRPTFVVDLADQFNYGTEGIQIIYANPAFHAQPSFLDQATLDSLIGASSDTHLSPLKAFVLARSPAGKPVEKQSSTIVEGNVLWAISTLRGRLRVISATPVAGRLEVVHMQTASPAPAPAPSPGINSSTLMRHRLESVGPGSPLQRVDYAEPMDYFGMVSETSSDGPSRQLASPIASIEQVTDSSSSINATKSDEADRPGRPGDRFPAEDVLSAACASNYDSWQSEKEIGFFDWTRLPVSEELPDHIQFARSVDWSSTALGPIESWSADLRQMCNLIMASPHPAAMYWGEDLVAIYNEAYVMLAGQKHPKLMGQSYREAWAEIWDEVKDVFANAQTTGQATMKDDDCLFIKRNNFLEETYFSWSIIPMVGGDGSVMGLYNPAFEKSRRKIAERRMLTLREVGERTAAARDVKSFWAEVLAALECNEFDTPFVLLYSLHGEAESGEDASSHSASTRGMTPSRQCQLEGALGVPLGHTAAPPTTDMQGAEGYAPILREAQRINKPIVLDAAKGEIPERLLEGLDVRGFGDPVQSIVVCPIHPTTGESTLGFLILGVNPRRPFDEDYNLFVQLLGRQLATSLASVVLFEEEIKRGQQAAKLAALDRIQLSEQLAARTQEARDSETKFTRMAEFVPVGMFIASSEGVINYCNDSWFEITRVPPNNMDDWMNFVMEEDITKVKQLWHDIVENKQQLSAEFRFKAPWTDRNGTRGETWVILSAYPERDDIGNLKSVFGSITNISTQKWAEGLQKRKTEEAVEMKRQQENFIDMTSHEMRNPLSAILQCADEIILSLGEKKKDMATHGVTDLSLCDDNIDAAHTIALCAQHQKRIVDDILTLSKLDSALLMVTPAEVQPVTVAQRALKMFEGEVQNADIDMRFVVDKTFKDLNIDWCRFDPSRVLQVLINLTTNAIKFTSSESRRSITITLAASQSRFSASKNPVVSYFPTRSKGNDKTQTADWGSGEEVFIEFAVRDTGRGLSPEEKKLLFLRFSQASPRTHVQYGGSGLGLFISRELTELQGGEIGVASEAGKGSTFAFYIKARKCAPPTHGADSVIAAAAATVAAVAGTGGRKTPEGGKTKTTASASASTSATGARASGSSRTQPLRILIVEDNLVNQKVLQKQLKHLGCETSVANHGVEALERLRASWFWAEGGADAVKLDVVLMDQEMPVMDGLTCTRKIREMETEGKFRRHVPVIAVTANARDEQINTAMGAGMDNVVSKPFRIPELIPKIEELVRRYPAD